MRFTLSCIWCALLASLFSSSTTSLAQGGVQVADEVFEEYKLIKKGKKYRYIIYLIEGELGGNLKLKIDTSGARDATFDDFKNYLVNEVGEEDCRFGLYDYEFEDPANGGKTSKLGLFIWAPDT